MAFKLQYIDKVPCEGNFFSDYGTFSHKLIEEWAKDRVPMIALAEEYDDKYDIEITHDAPPFPKGMPLKYYEAGKKYFDEFNGFGDNYEILAVEEKFEITIGGHQFVGIVDLILRDKETKEIIVIDHKSKSMNSMKKELDTYRKQLYTYAAHVKEKYGVFPSKLRFNMFRDGTFIDEDFDINEYEKTLDWIKETIQSILDEREWKVSSSSYFCRWICSVLDSCPARDAVLNGKG